MSHGRRCLLGFDALASILAISLELMLSFALSMASYCRRFLIGFDALACIIDVLEGFLKTMCLKICLKTMCLKVFFKTVCLNNLF